MRKMVIIGLDCAPDSLLFEHLSSELPTLRSLVEHGLWGTLVSTDPPITIPAWTTITTGRDPGELGLYGFRNRLAYDQYELTVVNSSHVVVSRVWDYLERAGAETLLLAIPQTYPPHAHKGITVAGFPTPSFDAPFCYPPEIADDVLRISRGKYVNDIKEFRKKDKNLLLADLYSAVEGRFSVARHFIVHKPWDFFMMVETSTDRLHHGFWADYDPSHPNHMAGSQFERVIPDFYRFVDQQIASIIDLLSDDTTVMVISDHGAGPLKGVVAINEWLIAMGYLKLRRHPGKEAPLTPDMVDWASTAAWGEGGYYGRIFINTAGRESSGRVNQADYETFREELAHKLRNIVDDRRGLSVRNIVLKPRDLYATCRNVPPDLIVYFDDLNYRSSGLVGGGEVFPPSNGEGMDEANHKPNGVFIMARIGDLRSKLRRGQRIGPISCMDITPTVLQELEVSIPSDLRGTPVAVGPGTATASDRSRCSPKPHAHAAESDTAGFTEEEEEIITQRLKDLGYM